jgi:hypothetical protein
MSLSNPCGVPEPFVVEANEIFQASLSTNTWNSNENGMSAFNKFRKNYNLVVNVIFLRTGVFFHAAGHCMKTHFLPKIAAQPLHEPPALSVQFKIII